MRQALSSESGFTLIELLVASVAGIVVVFAGFSLLDSSVTLTGNVTDHVDSASRARTAMDQMTRELRSEVCTSATTAVLAGSPNAITFFEYTGSAAGQTGLQPDKHQLRFVAGASGQPGTIYDDDYGSKPAGSPASAWPISPISTRAVLTGVMPLSSGGLQYNVPVFSYYGYGSDPTQGTNTALGTAGTLASGDLSNVADVRVQFLARPSGPGATDTRGTTIQTDVFVRGWDPNTTPATPPACL